MIIILQSKLYIYIVIYLYINMYLANINVDNQQQDWVLDFSLVYYIAVALHPSERSMRWAFSYA